MWLYAANVCLGGPSFGTIVGSTKLFRQLSKSGCLYAINFRCIRWNPASFCSESAMCKTYLFWLVIWQASATECGGKQTVQKRFYREEYHKWHSNNISVIKSAHLRKPGRQGFLEMVPVAWDKVLQIVCENLLWAQKLFRPRHLSNVWIVSLLKTTRTAF